MSYFDTPAYMYSVEENKIYSMLVYYLASNHQKLLIFIRRDIDLRSHLSSYLLRYI